MLDEARRKFQGAVPLHEADIRELPVFGKFELVLALNDVVNYLLEDGDLERALLAMRSNLAPNGLILFDTNTLGAFHWISSVETEIEIRDEWEWRGLTQRVAPGGIFDSRISGPGVETHIHRERHYAVEEIQDAIEAAGMRTLATFGQQEIDDRVVLSDDPDETRDHKIIHICRQRGQG